MIVQEIVDEIIATVGRPDKADTIMRAVRASITTVHGSAMFPRDRVEELFPLAEPSALIKLTLPARFKSFTILAAMSEGGAPVRLTTDNNQYTRTDPSGIFDNSIENTTDVYYVAGAVFNIRSSVAVSEIYALYQRFPEVADTQLETWIMREQDSLITDLALSKVYSAFGRDKLAREFRTRWEFDITLFISQNIVEGIN